MIWTLVNVIGAVASVVGAVVSGVGAGRAKAYAQRAEEQISMKRQLTDLATIEARWREVYRQLAPFGPSANPDSLRGKRPADAARHAQDFLEEIRSRSHSISSIPSWQNSLVVISTAISDFAEAEGTHAAKSLGTKLLILLGDLMATMRSLRVKGTESVDL